MKTILITIVAVLIFIGKTYSQYYIDSLTVIVFDNIGNRDSVILGFEQDATIGLDKYLGEEDVTALPYNSLDIRSIQNSYKNPDGYWFIGCTYNSNFISFDQDLELKKDIRYIWNNPYTAAQDFILKIRAHNYPVYIITKLNNRDSEFSEHFTSCCLFNDSLNKVYENKQVQFFNDTLFVIQKENQGGIVVIHSEIITGAKQIEKYGAVNVFPNPCGNYLTISLSDISINQFEVYNISGKLVDTFCLDNIEETFDISSFSPGIYILKNSLFVHKFIKTERL